MSSSEALDYMPYLNRGKYHLPLDDVTTKQLDAWADKHAPEASVTVRCAHHPRWFFTGDKTEALKVQRRHFKQFHGAS